jgi:hypothetical protein
MMVELKYFLGFEIKQLQHGTFINREKYIQDMHKIFFGPQHVFVSQIRCRFRVVSSGVPRSARSCEKSPWRVRI